MFEYRVVELQSKLWGGAMPGQKLQVVLNQWAAQGWALKSMTAVDVRGRVGVGSVDGLMVVFERLVQVQQQPY